MAVKPRTLTGKITRIKADEFTWARGGGINAQLDWARIADAIQANPPMTEYFSEEKVLPTKVVVQEKVVEKTIREKGPDPNSLSPEEVALIGEVLMIREHQLHDETKRDYIETGGSNWRMNHEKAQTTLTLRQKLGLGEHKFSVECCVPIVEEADMATLAITAHGIDAGAPVRNGEKPVITYDERDPRGRKP